MAADAMTGLERMLIWLKGGRPAWGIVRLLGIRPVAVEHGTATLEADPDETHVNFGGTVHGGYIATLLDTAMGSAAITVLGADKTVTTLEMKVTFQRAVAPTSGRLLVHGHVLSHGRRVVFTEARLTDVSGRTLASGSSTLLILER